MNRTFLHAALFAALFIGIPAGKAATFNYHGNLQEAGKAAEGTYDLELTLYATAEGGKVLAGPLQMFAVPVHDGAFSTHADFGVLTSVPQQAWLGVRVRKAGDATFAALDVRAPVGADAVETASCPGSWTLGGNAGNIAGSYLGTADNQPLIFKVNGTQAGSITPGKGVAFNQAGFGATATGQDAFATGEGAFANGTVSFAAGFGATAGQAGSYMWGDSNAGTGGIGATTGANQYVVRAGAGVAINGVPKDSTTELSIYPSRINGANYSDIFLGNINRSGGILLTVGDESTATSNDAALYVDQYDGTNEVRRLQVSGGGVGINHTPLNANTELTIGGSPTAGDSNVDVALVPKNSTWGYDINVQGTVQSDDSFYLSQTDGSSYLQRLGINQQGLIVNNPTSIPAANLDGDLNIVGTPGDNALVNLFTGSRNTTYKIIANDGGFYLSRGPFNFLSFDNTTSTVGLNFYVTIAGDLDISGDLSILGAATKPGGGPWAAPSDRRIKQDVVPIAGAVDTLLKLRPVSFHYTADYRAMQGGFADKPFLGFVAQEFAEVFPEAVTSSGKHVPGGQDDAPILELDSNPALITTVAAVQELAIRTNDRDDEIAKLHAENAELRVRLDALAARMDTFTAQRSQ